MSVINSYNNDPQFRALVELIYAHMCQANFSAQEVREAATLAAIKFAENNFLDGWRREVGL